MNDTSSGLPIGWRFGQHVPILRHPATTAVFQAACSATSSRLRSFAQLRIGIHLPLAALGMHSRRSDSAIMPSVEMYSTAFCPYCVRARRLLKNKGVEFQEIRVDKDMDQMQAMIQRSQRTTVPQIFIGEQHIGGYDDMAALDRAGKLDPMLSGA